mmetsp:Transcript_31477/g.43691  ORF Transcript_31477/g.43691 Transcript_31477/m.43691 type:complete len:234 (+) Transcript_31477:167-868(+)
MVGTKVGDQATVDMEEEVIVGDMIEVEVTVMGVVVEVIVGVAVVMVMTVEVVHPRMVDMAEEVIEIVTVVAEGLGCATTSNVAVVSATVANSHMVMEHLVVVVQEVLEVVEEATCATTSLTVDAVVQFVSSLTEKPGVVAASEEDEDHLRLAMATGTVPLVVCRTLLAALSVSSVSLLKGLVVEAVVVVGMGGAEIVVAIVSEGVEAEDEVMDLSRWNLFTRVPVPQERLPSR